MVCVTGDIHGDLSRLDTLKLQKNDTLIICGDFGFIWDGTGHEAKVLKFLGKRKFRICFIDGTHENFDLLDQYPETEFHGGMAQNISGNLWHLMRGQVYSFEGKRYFCMGGGESPDLDDFADIARRSRREYPSEDELYHAEQNLRRVGMTVDYIITHEPPGTLKDFLTLRDNVPARRNPFTTWLDDLSENVKYERWFFGSMHLDKVISRSRVAVFRKIYDAVTCKTIEN